MTKINLGSGPSGIEGWINYDWGLLPMLGKLRLNILLVKMGILEKGYGVEWPKICLRDIRRPLPIKNNSVDYVYCSNVLEHFKREETVNILKEIKRVLKKNGWTRLVLPDLEIIGKKYLNSEQFNNVFNGFEGNNYGGLIGNIKNIFIRPHQWMYSKNTFIKLLKEVGFENIKTLSYRKGRCPDLDRLDLPIHRELGFYIEAGN